MSNSYRIRTEVGVDKSLKILLDQEFEYLEILSLKVLQSQIYTRQCADYGVIIGRVTANNGFGIPNAKVSVFIPLSSEDENNPIISELYPYKTLTDTNEDGYRYNLLPYTQQHSGHNPTGTFFDRMDVLVDPTLIEVYDKYYKYTAKTNDSGDFMIFGVPVGEQTVHVDVDLSDIGEFSLSPQDLVRTGSATESQVAGTTFKSSSNLNSLPQIISINRVIEVEPLWGQPEICNLGITRTDFDLTSEANIDITPTAIFMGSIISDADKYTQKKNCKPKIGKGNLCNLVAGPGEILAIRQTIQQDINGRPVLEEFQLESGGQVIDENGTWLIDVPMNMDYYVTNEFGEKVLSNDPKKGVPTRGKYRFKVKWNQSPSLSENVKRGYFLVPNVKEHGWEIDGGGNRIDPLINPLANPSNVSDAIKSYSFSLDWDDYSDIQSAIDCEDTFYDMQYNKVYTVSQLIDQYRNGYAANRIIAVKHILDDVCESENVKFPTNDAFLRFDIIYILFTIMMFIFKPIIYLLLVISHILAFLLKYILGPILAVVVAIVFTIIIIICEFINGIIWVINLFADVNELDCPNFEDMQSLIDQMLNLWTYFVRLNLPNLSYDDCELCACDDPQSVELNAPGVNPVGVNTEEIIQTSGGNSYLTNFTDNTKYNINPSYTYPSAFQTLMAGAGFTGSGPKTYAPQMTKYGEDGSGNDRNIFTSSIPITERINLFNNKAKYFDDFGGTNPGGGSNRIKVTFDTTLNNSTTKYHYDNVITIMCKASKLSNFQAGQIISFQDPTLSQDVNLTGFTQLNQFATTSITGTSINDNPGSTINVTYSNPSSANGLPLQSTIYSITQTPDDATYAKFPMDIEYFQVVTAMTYNSFDLLCTSNPLSLNDRYLNNTMKIEYINYDNCWNGTYPENPLTSYDDYENQVLVFLVRGVDPYSTRKTNSYDLSRIFGYNTWGIPGLTITGEYKLNHPIKGGVNSVRHTMVSDTTNTDALGYNLYYDSFHFVPEINPASAGFTGFTSTLPSYYSSLDLTNLTFTPTGGYALSNACDSGVFNAASVKSFVTDRNGFQVEWDTVTTVPCTIKAPYQNIYSVDNRGYFDNEIVEGGSVMMQIISLPPLTTTSYADGYTYSPKYPTSPYTYTLGVSGNQIIMRSDRLPTSTSTKETSGNSFSLQLNPDFSVFLFSDDGVVNSEDTGTQNVGSYGNALDSEPPQSNISNQVIDSFKCGDMVPLGCYQSVPGSPCSASPTEIGIKPVGDGCYENGTNGELIMKNGCYVTITEIFMSLPKDFEILTEWSSRLLITFGACRNVWSQMFTNNWINGTLYAFAFKNDRFFTGPTDTPPNSPYSRYCRDTLFLHPTTNNFYYRSSPWDGNDFIGSDPDNGFFGSFGGNDKNLKFPTTMLDMGPRTNYIQELVMSDDYDGYVANKLGSTTFTDISDILNLFIISRLANTSFLSQLFGTSGANITSYFNGRTKRMVDGDYAQMVSISSELGVAEFDADSYPQIPNGQDPVYFNGANSSDGVFGIFFSSDTQVRDYITPKRTIIDENTVPTNSCAFSYFKVFSQNVPFYQWKINQGNADSIFGSQTNEWYTSSLIGNGFHSSRYQSMDRILGSSRYMRTNTSTLIRDFKGYIYSYNTSAPPGCVPGYNPNANSTIPNNPGPRIFTVGAPFHFYFGLKKGKTAFDRFTIKWIKTDVITD
jgi:hypothetical protein